MSAAVQASSFGADGRQADVSITMNFPELGPSDLPVPRGDQLRLAVAAYLARFKGSSRYHTDSDLRCYLAWSAERGLDPLAARRPHLELYIRWMQEIRRFKPSTVSRRFSVTAGFYRTCVIDGLLEHSPAGHGRRPSEPAESPTLGLHSPAVRGLAHRGPRNFVFLRLRARRDARAARLADLRGHRRGDHRPGRSTATGCCGCAEKAPRSFSSRCRPPLGGPSTRPSAGVPADPSCSIAEAPAWTAMPQHVASGGSLGPPGCESPTPTPTCSGTRSSRPVGRPRPAGRADRRPPRRSTHYDALQPSPQEPRPPPELHPGRLHGLRHLTASSVFAHTAVTHSSACEGGSGGVDDIDDPLY